MVNNNDRDGLISVIVLAYNNYLDLVDCIPAIVAQSYRYREIIVVDNGSIDESREFIRTNYPDIKLIETGSNLGYAGGNNVGFRHAKGEYIVVVNPDTVADRDWLSELVRPLTEDPGIAMTTSKILMYGNKNVINTCGNDSHYTGLNFCRGLGEQSSAYEKPMEVEAISGCSFAVRRKVIEELGGFDPDFFLYLEDDDLSWRARLQGYKIMFIPSSVIYHKYKLSITPEKEYYLERNRYLLLLKNYRLKTLILLMPALGVTELVTWGHALLNGLPYMYGKIRAYWWVLRNLGTIRVKRHEVRKMRKAEDNELIRLLGWKIPFGQVIRNQSAKKAADLTFNVFYNVYFRVIKKLV